MLEVTQAQDVLAALGMPPAQHNEMAALTLLALAGLKPEDDWSSAERRSLTLTKGIMHFIRDAYGRAYAPNTRETFRRQVLHQFVQGRIVDYNPDSPALPTNSPNAHYALSEAALAVVQTYGRPEWREAVRHFRSEMGNLMMQYAASRQSVAVAVTLPDGSALLLSPGEHNQLQAQVLSVFAPQFASGAQLLYLGDTADKDMYIASQQLAELGISLTEHDKLPDVILYVPQKGWLYLIEVVTSHGPMTPKRVIELDGLLKDCSSEKIFVTVFSTFAEFRKHLRAIAWETEVWVAEAPDHLIHFNGDRFLGPR